MACVRLDINLYAICNSYIIGARDVWHLLHRSPRAHACDITILYPVGTATIVTIDIDADLSFVTKRDTNEQGYL